MLLKKIIIKRASNDLVILIRSNVSTEFRCEEHCAKFCKHFDFEWDFIRYTCGEHNNNLKTKSKFSYIPLEYYVSKKTENNK